MSINMVRITVTDGLSRKQVFEEMFSPAEKTPGIAAKDLIEGGPILRDGDIIEVSFLEHDPTPWCSACGAKTEARCDCGPIAWND